ncbi:MAG: class I SAM-dependent methyltransferase [Candidatus Berkelbacteria bacterium]
MAIHWTDPKKLQELAQSKMVPANIILDIGCGIQPQTYQKAIVHICAEPFGQYVKKLQELVANRVDQQFVVINADWASVIKLIPPKSVDSIYILDVIEHLPKAEGRRLLKQTEKLARKQIILFTPVGFMPQHCVGKDAWGLGGVQNQEHLSGWEPKEFDKTWDIYAAKNFHLAWDYEVSKKKYGAFFAIKNIDKTVNPVALKLFEVWNTVVLDLNLSYFCLLPLRFAVKISRLIRQAKKKLRRK